MKNTVRIPQNVFRNELILGMTFWELVILACVPLSAISISVWFKEIPVAVAAGVSGVLLVITVIIAYLTPPGQTPIEWAPAKFKRHISPSSYNLRPRQYHRSKPVIVDRIVTAESLNKPPSEESADEEDSNTEH